MSDDKYRGLVRRYRFALGWRWWLLHVITVALVVTMVLLGRWQLHVSESKHFSLQNFGYTVQWWLFSGFALFFWSRLVRDAARREAGEMPTVADAVAAADEPVAYRRYIPPTTTAARQQIDPVRSAYNDYLADLAKKDAQA